MNWGWVCLCGLLWPSSVTLWWLFSYSSFSVSSTRPANFLHNKRRCWWLQSQSRRRLNRNICWLLADLRVIESCSTRYCRVFTFFPNLQFLLFSLYFICVICGANWPKSCGKTNNNKLAKSSYLCCVLQHCPSAWMFVLLYTGSPRFPLLLPSILSFFQFFRQNCKVTMD